MNHHNQVFIVIGLAVAFAALFFLLLLVVRKKQLIIKAEYDERQVAARGKAFRAGFFAMVLYFGVLMVVSIFGLELTVKYTVPVIFGGIIFGTAVFAVMAVIHDAYFQLHEKKSQQYTLILMTVANIASGLTNYFSEESSVVFFLNFLCAGLGIVILAASLLHQKKAAGYTEDTE
ncbi:MAG: hypothetical protein HUJ67_03445 [Ruminiclostridium sp.]|nr:hypothetical protein [Ruminiclostridium sp.]